MKKLFVILLAVLYMSSCQYYPDVSYKWDEYSSMSIDTKTGQAIVTLPNQTVYYVEASDIVKVVDTKNGKIITYSMENSDRLNHDYTALLWGFLVFVVLIISLLVVTRSKD